MAEPTDKEAVQPAAPAPGEKPGLDELMMAMDVVDTLRHEERMVAKDIAQADRDDALKTRLRDLYESQGLEVSDRILEEGIAALKEQRFVYAPPEPSWRVTLAKLWVERERYGYIAGIGVLLIVGWLAWSGLSASPEERMAAEIAALSETAQAIAATEPARQAIAAERAAAERAIAAGALDEAEHNVAALKELKFNLGLEYELRIVTDVGERSGVFRIPDVNQSARNYYLIVEAIAPGGERLTRPVSNEETGKTMALKRWGQRVPEHVYEAVRADKQDDGILQHAVVGTKARGTLDTDYAMPVLDGAITEW